VASVGAARPAGEVAPGGSVGNLSQRPLPSWAVSDREADDLAADAFRRHRQQVYRYLLRRTGHEADAEDLTQKVFADAAVALRAGTRPDSLLAWLYAVAERRFVDYVRRIKSRPEASFVDNVADPRDLDYDNAVAKGLIAAMANLPEDQRRVIVMKLFEGRAFAEIARSLGVSEGAAKMRFSRGLARLRDELRERGVEP
jgi:RNA polymerase sigma factor (sigma-70 family)